MSSLITAPAVLAHLEPLEGLVLPPSPVRRAGAIGGRVYPKSQPMTTVLRFWPGSRATGIPQPRWASYRKEAERLLLWCVHQHGAALSDLTMRTSSHTRELPWRPTAGRPLGHASRPEGTHVLAQLASFAKPLTGRASAKHFRFLTVTVQLAGSGGHLAEIPLPLGVARQSLGRLR